MAGGVSMKRVSAGAGFDGERDGRGVLSRGFAGEFRSDDSAGGSRVSRCRCIGVRSCPCRGRFRSVRRDVRFPIVRFAGRRVYDCRLCGCRGANETGRGYRGTYGLRSLAFRLPIESFGPAAVPVVNRSISSVAAGGCLVRVACGCLSGSDDLTGCLSAVRPVYAAGVSVWEDSCGGCCGRAGCLRKRARITCSQYVLFFCRGDRIRTCDPLLPKQIR